MSVWYHCKCHFRNVELAIEYYGAMRGRNVTNSVHAVVICLKGPEKFWVARQDYRKKRDRVSEAAGSLLVPGFSAVRAAPGFVVTGENDNLRRAADVDINININVSYVGAKLLAFNGRLHLYPSYTAVSGVEERTCLPASPNIRAVSCVAQ